MSIFQSIIFGIVEGITEFLPISSTAHLDIARILMSIPATSFVKSFEIAIQLGAIFAVVILYWRKIFSSLDYFKNILIAFIPTGIIGFALYKIIKSFLLGNTILAASMLVLGGIVILLFEKREKSKEEDKTEKDIKNFSIKELISLGLIQALAVVPGVSRSGAVIIGGRLLGLPKVSITEFSFLLAIPTMLAATVYDLYKSGFAFLEGEWMVMAIGFFVSFVIAVLAVKWLIAYIQKNSFAVFGWYRVLIGLIIIAFLVI